MKKDLLHDNPIDWPSLHDPEGTTAKIAKKITLDLNDSHLLIDHLQSGTSTKQGTGLRDTKVTGRGGLSHSFGQRYNVSNDEAYDLLKENHQHKIRGTLGNPTIEHSLPAVRLQWPFVRVTFSSSSNQNYLTSL